MFNCFINAIKECTTCGFKVFVLPVNKTSLCFAFCISDTTIRNGSGAGSGIGEYVSVCNDLIRFFTLRVADINSKRLV